MMGISRLEDGVYLDVNDKFEEVLGFTREEAIGTSALELGIWQHEDRQRAIDQLNRQGFVTGFPLRARCKDGKLFDCVAEVVPLTVGGAACVLVAVLDVTEQRRHEAEREAMLALLRLLNSPTNTQELVEALTGFLQEWTGCAAVDIRLRESDDQRLYEARKTRREPVGPAGQPCQLFSGAEPAMTPSERLCDRMLAGHVEPGAPGLSASGSFWTSSSSGTSPQGSPGSLCPCMGAAVQSAALIPLRSGGQTLGLIALADLDKHRFTARTVAFLEQIGASIANALAQRHLQFALRRNQERFRAIADYTAGWENWFDPDGKLLWVNPSVEKLTGFSVAECHAMEDFPLPLVLAADREYMRSHLRPPSQQSGESGVEFRMVRKDGRIIWAELTWQSIRDDDGRPIGRRASFRDISSRRAAQDALQLNEERLALALAATSDGFFDWQCDTGRVYWSPRCAEILGYSQWDLPTRPEDLRRLVHPDDLPRVRQTIDEYFAGNRPAHSLEMRLRSKPGEWRWILSRGALAARDAAGRPLRLVGTHSDVTERKRSEEEKTRLEGRLQHARRMEGLGRLAGGIAHDFNNLLTVVNGFAALLRPAVTHDPGAVASLEEIARATARAVALSRQLLALSRQHVGEPRTFDLNQMIAGLERMLGSLLGSDVALILRVPSRPCRYVHADPGLMEQVLMNLAVNARDAMPEGGQLIIETAGFEQFPDEPAPVEEMLPGPYALLRVTDTGRGMDAATLARVFEPFITREATDECEWRGLPLVHQIITSSSGYIRVASTPGAGAEFQIYIPQLADAPEPCVSGSVSKPDRGDGKILVIDDDAGVLRLTAQVLGKAGYTVLSVQSGPEALQVCARHLPEIRLVLSDVVMPGMSGPELLRGLQTLRPDLKVIFMSGYRNVGARDRELIDAAAGFIGKPFSPEQLVARVDGALAAKPEPARKGPAAILVVDDSTAVRKVVRRILEDAGYRILEAQGASSARQSLEKEQVDLMITDLNLPGGEGGRQLIGSLPDGPGKPKVIVMSGSLTSASLDRALFGADELLPKPTDPDVLVAAVRRLLGR